MWEFLKNINSAGTTIILTTHYLEEAEHLCRNIGIINNGALVENTSMRALLRQLNLETFVLDLEKMDIISPPYWRRTGIAPSALLRITRAFRKRLPLTVARQDWVKNSAAPKWQRL